MFDGYFGDPAQTSEALTSDGYFRTGDIGRLEQLPNGKRRVILLDRKKNLFKLSHGEFISPERLEGKYLESSLVDQIWIGADIERSILYAVAHPYLAEVTRRGITGPALGDEILRSLCQVALDSKLRRHEIPRGVIVAIQPFSVENDQLTPTGKLCRRKIELSYLDQIQPLLEELASSNGDPLTRLGLVFPRNLPSIQGLVNQVLQRDVDTPLNSGTLSFLSILLDLKLNRPTSN